MFWLQLPKTFSLQYNDTDGCLVNFTPMQVPAKHEIKETLRSCCVITVNFKYLDHSLGRCFSHVQHHLLSATLGFNFATEALDTLPIFLANTPKLHSLSIEVNEWGGNLLHENEMALILQPLSKNAVRHLSLSFEFRKEFGEAVAKSLCQIESFFVKCRATDTICKRMIPEMPRLSSLTFDGSQVFGKDLYNIASHLMRLLHVEIGALNGMNVEESINLMDFFIRNKQQCKFLDCFLPFDQSLARLRTEDCEFTEGCRRLLMSMKQSFFRIAQENKHVYIHWICTLLLQWAIHLHPVLGNSLRALLSSILSFINLEQIPASSFVYLTSNKRRREE